MWNTADASVFGECKGILEQINGAFHGNTVPIEIIPTCCISRNTGTETEILARIGIDTPPIGRICAGCLTSDIGFSETSTFLEFLGFM